MEVSLNMRPLFSVHDLHRLGVVNSINGCDGGERFPGSPATSNLSDVVGAELYCTPVARRDRRKTVGEPASGAPTKNVDHEVTGDAEALCHRGLRLGAHGQRAHDLADHIRTGDASSAGLSSHVPHVVAMRAKEEVRWVAAWRIVTSMTDFSAGGIAEVDEPRVTMGVSGLAVAESEAPIPPCVAGHRPFKAFAASHESMEEFFFCEHNENSTLRQVWV